MNLNPLVGRCLFTGMALALGSCGGGGGTSASSAGAATPPPTSGTFAWVLEAQGPTDGLQYGLSLLHPSTPDVEYVIEFGSSVVTDARLISVGTVDATGLKANSLSPYALLYIIGGDVRRVPMVANGATPISQVQRAQSTTACKFLLDGADYGTPEHSRYVVSTAGADGQCGTADDGSAEVALGGASGLTFTPITGAAPLGLIRDVTTLAPSGWIYPKSVVYWNPGPGTTVATRSSTDPAVVSVVAATYSSALVDDGVKLGVLDFSTITAPIETDLDPTSTAGGGWSRIGFDASNFYVYRNSGATAASNWTVLKINRATPTASVLATGSGLLTVGSMGSTQLYATIVGTGGNSLLGISKTNGVPVDTIESTASTTLTTVQTSANDVHELWRVVNVGTGAVNYALEMIDESGAVLYSTSSGGFPMAVAEADTVDFNASESRTRFLFANGYGSRAFGDASLVGYDTVSHSAVSIGTLPGLADFGTNFVFASALGGPGNFMAGYAAESSGGVVQEAGSKVFSFDITVPGSVHYTSIKQ